MSIKASVAAIRMVPVAAILRVNRHKPFKLYVAAKCVLATFTPKLGKVVKILQLLNLY